MLRFDRFSKIRGLLDAKTVHIDEQWWNNLINCWVKLFRKEYDIITAQKLEFSG